MGDCEAMHHRWKINLATDFGIGKVAVGELLQANLSARAMHACGIDVDTLVDRMGMTPDVMRLFHLTLQEWIKMGLRSDHIAMMTYAQVDHLFSVPKNVLEASLLN